MRITATKVMMTALLLVANTVAQQKNGSGQVLLEAARQKETLEGDLKGAIKEYEEVLKRFAGDRSLVATALVRMAECHRRLGDATARGLYERVVREYADQKGPVDEARTRLAAMRPATVSAPATAMSSKRIWTVPQGGDSYGRVSPDGRYVPYVNWNEFGDLFLHDLVTGADRRLTNAATDGKPGIGKSQSQYAEEWAFSRDGKEMVYSWFNGSRYELRTVGLQGTGTPAFRKLLDNNDIDWIGPHDWSPDGKWIAVQLHRMDKTAQLALVSPVDGTLKVLKSVDWRGVGGMFFSADGKWIAYDLPAAEDSQQRDIFVMATDASRELPVVLHPAQDAVLGWSPDEKRLLFASDRSGSVGVWSVQVSDAKPQGAPEFLKSDLGNVTNLGITASGLLYYSPSKGPRGDVHTGTFDFGRGEFVTPPEQAVQSYVGSNYSPDWSRDGKYLAYYSRRDSVNSRYFVIGIRRLDGGNTREIVPFPNFSLFWSLTWSHDDKSFLVGGRDAKGRIGVFRVDAGTGRSSLVLEGARASRRPLESPDGKYLYYPVEHDDGRETAVVRREVLSGQEKELLRRANIDRFLSLSPDGKYLAVHEINAARAPVAVLLLPTSGDAAREIVRVSDPQRSGFFAWTPDGKSMLTRKMSGPGNAEHWLYPLDGGEPVQLGAPRPGVPALAVHPDGKRVAYAAVTRPQPFEIWALENFLPAATVNK